MDRILERLIVDMKTDKAGNYDAAEIADAIDVYLDLESPDTLAEAKDLIAEHLIYSSQIGAAFTLIGEMEGEADATGEIAKSEKQQKADQKAAEKALQAAKLEADAKKKEETRLGILSSAGDRADKKRQRANRRKAALDRRAARLKELAAKKAALGEKRAAAGERAALRTERWANFRARWAARSAERLRQRAEKARLASGTTAATAVSAAIVAREDAEIGHELCMEKHKTIGASISKHHADVGTALCETCHSQESLLRCAGCKGVWYCSSECQAADWNHGGHPDECAAIQAGVQWSDAAPAIKARHLHRIVTALTQ